MDIQLTLIHPNSELMGAGKRGRIGQLWGEEGEGEAKRKLDF